MSGSTPQDMARQTGYPIETWQEVEEILGDHWSGRVAETVAHLAVRGDRRPQEVARILVGGSGFPGVLDLAWD